MKKSIALICLVVVLSILSCKRAYSQSLNNEYDLSYNRIELYEVRESLEPVLDDIINTIDNNPKYKNCHYGFFFHAIKDSKISIILADYSSLLISDMDALFFYRGYKFAYLGSLLDHFFKRNGTTANCKISTKKPAHDSKVERIDIIGYEWYLWDYCINSNDTLTLVNEGELYEASILTH